jgi:FkbM family methyltransferase
MTTSNQYDAWTRLRRSANRILRRALLPVFAIANPGDVTIRHHYTGDPVRLHSFKHKGYWWHGARREMATMALFAELIRTGDVVLDVGSHIGYIALYFARLVGPQGRVFAFEPGPNNLPYIRRNVGSSANVTIVEKALSTRSGTEPLYVESLTGQNNSMLRNFEGLRANERVALKADVHEVVVEVTTLDDFARSRDVRPAFVKIDVEGFESEVLEGARETLAATLPRLMVEVQRHHDRVFALLSELGYAMFREDRVRIDRPDGMHLNTFCLHTRADADAIATVMNARPR